MMDDIKIVLAKPNHANDLIKVLSSASQRKLQYKDYSWDEGPYTKDEALRYINEAPTYIFYKDKEPIGTISISGKDVRMWGENNDNAAYIHRLAVIDGQKGIGIKILNWAEEIILKEGVALSRLDCDIANVSLCDYYKKQGYKIVSTTNPKGKNYTAALFEKRLVSKEFKN